MHFEYDLNPVDHIIADAVGEPGNRTFFLQGRAGRLLITLVLEKQEVANLAVSLLQLLQELEDKFEDLEPAESAGEILYPEHPFDPDFRISQLIIGYDEMDDMTWIIAKALIVSESGRVVNPDSDEVPAARFVITRNQAKAISEHALRVVGQGRPNCPLCGRPISADGHFCPRTDGHAKHILF